LRSIRRSRRPSPALRAAVRLAAATTLTAAVALPLVRRRLRLPPAVTAATVVAAPAALAVLRPRSRGRDVALFALQMWAFTIVHELPYDDPERLRGRLKVRYPIAIDRVLGAGELPNVRLQRALSRPGGVTALDRALSVVHWAWFFEPHLTLLFVQARHLDHFARAARQMAVTYDIGCALYHAVPTAPPWWASEHGYFEDPAEPASASPDLRRIMVDVGEGVWGPAWDRLYQSLGGNPWAAMPSLHFATSVMAALLLAEIGPLPGAVGTAYAATLGFALVYLGEHYVSDLLAGLAVVAVVRRSEPLFKPFVDSVNGVLQRLERIAAA
jgi:membrane-associated phospholipid phosphatase